MKLNIATIILFGFIVFMISIVILKIKLQEIESDNLKKGFIECLKYGQFNDNISTIWVKDNCDGYYKNFEKIN